MIRFDERNKRWRWEFNRTMSDGSGNLVRVRKSKLLARGLSRVEAEAVCAKLEAELFVKSSLVAQADEWAPYVEGMLSEKASWIHQMVGRTRQRAQASGKGGSLTAREIADLLMRSRGRCEITGIKFQTGKPERARAQPFFHSIDRIDCRRGYEAWNCRIVCYAVNVAMNNWGEDVFARIATGFVVNRYCAVGILAAGGVAEKCQPAVRTPQRSEPHEIA